MSNLNHTCIANRNYCNHTIQYCHFCSKVWCISCNQEWIAKSASDRMWPEYTIYGSTEYGAVTNKPLDNITLT